MLKAAGGLTGAVTGPRTDLDLSNKWRGCRLGPPPSPGPAPAPPKSHCCCTRSISSAHLVSGWSSKWRGSSELALIHQRHTPFKDEAAASRSGPGAGALLTFGPDTSSSSCCSSFTSSSNTSSSRISFSSRIRRTRRSVYQAFPHQACIFSSLPHLSPRLWHQSCSLVPILGSPPDSHTEPGRHRPPIPTSPWHHLPWHPMSVSLIIPQCAHTACSCTGAGHTSTGSLSSLSSCACTCPRSKFLDSKGKGDPPGTLPCGGGGGSWGWASLVALLGRLWRGEGSLGLSPSLALQRACVLLLALPCLTLLSLVLLLAPSARLHPPLRLPLPGEALWAATPLDKPPMGWNSWNHFACNISEQVIKETADALVSSGLAQAGYVYVNLDDCWQLPERDSEGLLVADPVAFPSGMKALGDYIHSKGLKFGVYSDAGYHTCAGRAGSLGHEEVDALTFASWGVDYLKYDNCEPGIMTFLPFLRYKSMGDALLATGRRIVFSMCEWGLIFPALWAKSIAHADLWRTTGDIENSWDSMMLRATQNNLWAPFGGPGGWNDPDMLEVGNGQLSPGEDRVHFSLWAIMKAPLLVGCDVRNLSKETKDVLLNAEAIAINQDPLGVQGAKVRSDETSEVWAGPLSGGRAVVALVNKGDTAASLSLELQSALHLDWTSAPYSMRDVWTAQTLVAQGNTLSMTVDPHDVALLVLSPGVSSHQEQPH